MGVIQVLRTVVVALAVGAVSLAAHAQASGVAVNVVVCGPAGASGVTYAAVAGRPVTCGNDPSGNPLLLQVSTQFVAMSESDGADDGGAAAGAVIGAAVISAMAAAYGIRVVRDFVNSSSEG